MDGFRIESVRADGTQEILGAKAVVFAVGPSSKPNVPLIIREALDGASNIGTGDQSDHPTAWSRQEVVGEAWCHSAAFALDGFELFSPRVRQKIRDRKQVTVVIIGGG